MAWLTKSRFMAGNQCHKRLWFEVHQPLDAVVATPVQIEQGNHFDRVVQGLEPGVIVSRAGGLPESIAETSRVLKDSEAKVLYQAAFETGGLVAVVDVLRKRRSSVDLVEIKGSSGVKDEHIPDLAFQVLVLQRAGLDVHRASVGHVDSRFVLKRPGHYDGIKRDVDVSERVFAQIPAVSLESSQHLEVMSATSMPSIAMGEHCHQPRDCPFLARCAVGSPKDPEYPVWILPHGGRQAAALLADGYADLRQVPSDRLTTPTHRRVHAATLSGRTYLDPDAARRLNALPYPRAYLDFETVNPAVPEVVGTRPFEQWPFQFSLHIEDEAGRVRHIEYLAIDDFADFNSIAGSLVAGVPATGPVFVYSAAMERTVLQQLARHCSRYHDDLMSLVPRLFDLLPLVKQAYYHPAMKGSWSIKKVLPTIDASLGYELLDGVADGMQAQRGFFEARDVRTAPERRAQVIAELRAYCHRDTWGMVVLRRFLCGETW